MGKMSFPEDLNRPSRTIMATRSASTREAMVLGGKKDKKGHWISYRMPTVREIGCVMSFPITYQFEASNESSKYRLVGNAVCPLIARAIGNAIREKEGLEPIDEFIALTGNPRPKVDLTGIPRAKKGQSAKKPDAKYARHIPYLKIKGFRAELDNHHSDFIKGSVIWSSVLHQGSGKDAGKCEVLMKTLESLLDGRGNFRDFRADLDKEILKNTPKAKELQDIFCLRTVSNKLGPDQILEKIRELIDNHYPEKGYGNVWVDNSEHKVGIRRDKIPLRVLVGLYALNRVVDRTNKQ
jgi:DNA (cytosine-5)-methyltransferase 1